MMVSLPRSIALSLVSAQHGLHEYLLRHPVWTAAAAIALACAGGIVVWRRVRRRPSAEDLERERRALLVRSGRIIDGTILDVGGSPNDQDAGQPDELRFVLYQYEIGGVVYECSQEVSALRDVLKAEDLRPGFPCSVRYDVRRPENSILVAENWSGLRQIASATSPTPPRHRPPTSALAAP